MSRSAGMLRTRAALLDAAADCVARCGVRGTTMGAIAAAGGVAKATLYNHFRTKDDVLAALVHDRAAALARECARLAASDGLPAALEHAGAVLAACTPLRRVALEEPARLVPLAVPADTPAWSAVRAGVAEVLPAAGVPADAHAGEAVLRWLLSQLLWPLAPDGSAAALVQGLSAASVAPEEGRDPGRARATGLGWPG